MTLPKRFLHKKTDSLRVPAKAHLIGLLTGLAFAVCFYAWMYMMRESLRLQSVNQYNEIITLSQKEVDFYNLFTAFIAMLTGQALYFAYLTGLPRIRRAMGTRRATSVFNDASNLLSAFLMWFIKMAFTYIVFFIMAFRGEYEIGVFAEYKAYFILFIVVIFLNQWLSLRRIFKNRGMKWMLISAIVISGLSFGLSRINFIDYRSVNKSVIANSVYNYADIELPSINDYESLDGGYGRSSIADIYLAKPTETLSCAPTVWVVDKLTPAPYGFTKTDLAELTGVIGAIDSAKYEYMNHFAAANKSYYGLKIDKHTPMKYVKELKKKLAGAGIIRVALSVLPEDMKGYSPRAYEEHSRFFSYLFDREHYEAQLPEVQHYTPVRISHSSANLYVINGDSYDLDGFVDKIYKLMRDADYVIIYDIADDVTYQEYINVIGNIKLALERLRREYIESRLNRSPRQSENIPHKEIYDLYPLRLIESIY